MTELVQLFTYNKYDYRYPLFIETAINKNESYMREGIDDITKITMSKLNYNNDGKDELSDEFVDMIITTGQWHGFLNTKPLIIKYIDDNGMDLINYIENHQFYESIDSHKKHYYDIYNALVTILIINTSYKEFTMQNTEYNYNFIKYLKILFKAYLIYKINNMVLIPTYDMIIMDTTNSIENYINNIMSDRDNFTFDTFFPS